MFKFYCELFINFISVYDHNLIKKISDFYTFTQIEE